MSPNISRAHNNKITKIKNQGILGKSKDIKNVLIIESIKAITRYCKKYDKKYVLSLNPIIFIPSFDLFSFSPTILYTYKHSGHIYAITIKKGIKYPTTELKGSLL